MESVVLYNYCTYDIVQFDILRSKKENYGNIEHPSQNFISSSFELLLFLNL